MSYVFVKYFLQPTNCTLITKYSSGAKLATKVLSKLVAAMISFSEGVIMRVWYPHLFMRVSHPVFEKPGITPVFF